MVAQAVLLLAVVFGAVSTYMRLFWIQVPLQLIVLLATGLAAWQFIPDAPIAGGARTALVRAVTQAVLYALCLLFGIARRKRGK